MSKNEFVQLAEEWHVEAIRRFWSERRDYAAFWAFIDALDAIAAHYGLHICQ